ncbi:MAG: hypothetical protein ACTSYA_08215 [Candidatus Kariarchaeaceae archaeon]
MNSSERNKIYSKKLPKLVLEGGDFNYVIFSDKETEKFVQFYSNKGSSNVYIDIPYLSIDEDEIERLLQLPDVTFKKENEAYVAGFTVEEGIAFVDHIFLKVFLLQDDFKLEVELVLD